MEAKLRLPRLISDGMVIQRNTRLKIWGWAEKGEKISLYFMSDLHQTEVTSEERWEIAIETPTAGGPYDMTIIMGENKEKIEIKDILVGDVWLCSGQSNMEMRMDSLTEVYPEEIAGAGQALIRQYMVPTVYNFEGPQLDMDGGSWQCVSPENILNFTATGYFFAKFIWDHYQIPIGLINASLGGSPAEAWLSEEALVDFPGYLEALYRFRDKNYVMDIMDRDQKLREDWCSSINRRDVGVQEGKKPFYAPDYDASEWDLIAVPSYWEEEGFGQHNGVMWFRKEVNLSADEANQKAVIRMGNILDEDSVYINGAFVGTLPMQYIPRRYDIPEGVLKEGRNIIVVRVVNYAGKGGFIKEKPYQLEVGGQVIDLSGEWQCKLGVGSDPLPNPVFVQWQPSGLYNAMIAPLLFYPIKGAIWYQGESNTGKPGEYESLLKTLISNWRSKWGDEFLFLFVQLPNFEEACEEPVDSDWAVLREGQRRTLEVPGTGMAVTIDIGEWNDIHPVNKKDVGKRLALAALRMAYGERSIVTYGPMYQSVVTEGNKARIIFSHTGSGLTTKDNKKPGHFAIAGADQRYVWAEAKLEGDCVIVWNDQVPDPRYIRYAWAQNPVGANLYNREGLPASPFCCELT